MFGHRSCYSRKIWGWIYTNIFPFNTKNTTLTSMQFVWLHNAVFARIPKLTFWIALVLREYFQNSYTSMSLWNSQNSLLVLSAILTGLLIDLENVLLKNMIFDSYCYSVGSQIQYIHSTSTPNSCDYSQSLNKN